MQKLDNTMIYLPEPSKDVANKYCQLLPHEVTLLLLGYRLFSASLPKAVQFLHFN